MSEALLCVLGIVLGLAFAIDLYADVVKRRARARRYWIK